MTHSNKNNAGIDSYLTAQKLFHKDKSITPKKKISTEELPQFGLSVPTIHNKRSKFQYNLLNHQSSGLENKRNQPLPIHESFEVRPKYGRQFDQRPIFDQSDEKGKGIFEEEIQTEKPLFSDQRAQTWESVVVQTSKKYFESCRNEALDFISKMQGILENDRHVLSNQMKNIRQCIHKNHERQGLKLKECLYSAVDKAIADWKQQCMNLFKNEEINYIAELLQLNTQVQQRLNQMKSYKFQIQDESNWKKRASDLLTANYEEDVLNLSNLCKQSVYGANQNAKKWIVDANEKFSSKLLNVEENYFYRNIRGMILSHFQVEAKEHEIKSKEPKYHQKNRQLSDQQRYYQEAQTTIKNHRRQIFHKKNQQSNHAQRKEDFCSINEY